MPTFLSREDWICGPNAPTDIQGLVCFTNGSGTGQGTEAGIYGPKTRLFFLLGEEICKRRLWKRASLTIGSSVGGT
jgi:hypothetical protein